MSQSIMARIVDCIISYFFFRLVDQLQRQMGVRFITTLYYIWPGVGILARKSTLVMNWYSFLGHEIAFLMILKAV